MFIGVKSVVGDGMLNCGMNDAEPLERAVEMVLPCVPMRRPPAFGSVIGGLVFAGGASVVVT